MDFTQFDSRAGAETAGRLHLKHPATGIPLYADEAHEQPCIVLVKGTEARSAQAAMRAARQAKLAGGKTGEDADSTLEDLHADLVKSAVPLISGFENILRGKDAATAADAEWFLNLNILNGQKDDFSFVVQVFEFASSRANYLGNGSKR